MSLSVNKKTIKNTNMPALIPQSRTVGYPYHLGKLKGCGSAIDYFFEPLVSKKFHHSSLNSKEVCAPALSLGLGGSVGYNPYKNISFILQYA